MRHSRTDHRMKLVLGLDLVIEQPIGHINDLENALLMGYNGCLVLDLAVQPVSVSIILNVLISHL